MGKLLIVDGSNLLFQMFYGMPARITGKSGKAIQGTLGFIGALGKIVRMTRPTHIAVLFDAEGDKERPALDEQYKANRPDWSAMDEKETPFSQLPDIYAALDHLGIRHTECTSVECDDVIASYAEAYGAAHEIVISSFDSDFFQLITEHVSVLRYRGDCSVICTPDHILQKIGVTPERYADYKSLLGDTADNIRGVPRVGPKTAAALINEYGSAEGVILTADKIRRPAIRESVAASAERIRLNYRLIKLTGDAPMPFTLDELEYTKEIPKTREVLESVGIV